MKHSAARFLLAVLLIAGTAIFLRAHTRNEVFPPRQTLDTFPPQLDAWTGADIPLSKDVRDVLGPGDFLLRVYRNEEKPELSASLFIAYFRSQRTGDTIHSPKNCLPGSGWVPLESTRVALTMPGHDPFPANRYVIAKGDARQVVLYWYWAHGRGVASEYWSKFYLIADSIRMDRSDGSLVRFTTPLYPGETTDDAQSRLLPFVNQVAPLLDTYIPR